ncbi:MAG: tRNA lysidine(34) synthetase TilS [Clostridia bacterium]|nr:tRNA lysidine(34) synthetase TilS [Clostridia bacterium]MBQ5773043.1 tRNA lysidine(34) synthetase TilS [Clostridia bacterium]
MPKQTMERAKVLLPQQLAGLPSDAPVLLALSGGADSRFLLDVLAEASRRQGFSLLLAHVDHGIRGEEAKRDSAFCRALAEQYGLELCLLEADVPRLAHEHGRGLEEEARRVRYAYFAELMQKRGIPLLATAHHADDHLETLLFRMARGSGLRGLCGIAPVRPFSVGFLTRPLLSLARAEILRRCEERGLAYVTDSTNADTAYARNRIRSEAIPALESLFEDPQGRAVRMSRALREDEDFLHQTAKAVLDGEHGDGLSLDTLRALHPAIRKRVLAGWLARFTDRMVETVHLEALSRALEQPSASGEYAVPGGRVLIEGDRLCFCSAPTRKAEAFCYPFAEGETVFPESGIRVRVTRTEKYTKINNLSTATRINRNCFFAIMVKNLHWRSRREGDRIQMGGMHRRLRKLWNEEGVPPQLRDRLPLLCDEEGILWAPFAGLRDGAKTEGEGYLVELLLPGDTEENT